MIPDFFVPYLDKRGYTLDKRGYVKIIFIIHQNLKKASGFLFMSFSLFMNTFRAIYKNGSYVLKA